MQQHHLQHTHVALTASEGECNTTYNTCGVKTASKGECSNTTYNTHVALKLQVKGCSIHTHTRGFKCKYSNTIMYNGN